MPYKTFSRDGRYCNYKVNANGEATGKSLGCFDSQAEARKQVKALYASESSSKELVHSEPIKASFTVKKDANGKSRWIASFSNNIRDNDNPPEILSAEAHRRFSYMVDKGLVEMPELWVYHEEPWAVGVADWMAVDEQEGFAFIVASGEFYEHAEEVASALALEKDVALSHGMYPHLIERDDPDQSIITGYVSREITVLPRENAANKLTAYASMENKMVKDEKRRSLAARWPALGEELLSRLEEANSANKDVAEELDLDTKSKEETKMKEETEATQESTTEPTVAEQETPETETPEEETESEEKKERSVSYDEIAEVLGVIGERLEKIEKSQSEAKDLFTKRIEAIERKDKAREESTKTNGLVDFLKSKSAVGKDETRVDGRTTKGKDGPEETKEENTGLFFEEYLRG